MRTRSRALVGAAVAAVAVVTAAPLAMADAGPSGSGSGDDLTAIGLVGDKKLVRFDVDQPERTRTIGKVTGLVGDKKLIGIDFRVQDGLMYGVGDQGGIYTIDVATAYANMVSKLTVALDGSTFDIDFNPAANALRVVSDTGQNLRHPFTVTPPGPTTADGVLTYPATPTAPAMVAMGVNGAAYTNNDLDPNSGTTLYDIDTMLDQVIIQSPANAGLVVATGKLGVDATADSGFDIYSVLRNGKAGPIRAFATVKVGDSYHLVKVRLSNGEVSDQGAFSFRHQVRDIALPLDQF